MRLRPLMVAVCGLLASDGFLNAQEPIVPKKRDILDHSSHPLGRRGLQDSRRISRHGPAQHPQGDAAIA